MEQLSGAECCTCNISLAVFKRPVLIFPHETINFNLLNMMKSNFIEQTVRLKVFASNLLSILGEFPLMSKTPATNRKCTGVAFHSGMRVSVTTVMSRYA